MVHKVLIDDPIVAGILVHGHIAEGHQIEVVALPLEHQAAGYGHALSIAIGETLLLLLLLPIQIRFQATAICRRFRPIPDDELLLQLPKILNLGGSKR